MSTPAEILAIPQQGAVDGNPSVRRNAFWNLAGNGFYAICQWAMISLMARKGESAQVGEFALALSITAPIFMFGNLQLRGIQISDARNEHAFGDYFALRIAGSLLSVVTTMVLGLVFCSSSSLRWVVFAVGLAKGIESISDIHQGVMQKRERMDLLALSLFLKGGASLSAFVFTFLVSHRVLWACLAMALAQSLTLCFYDIPGALRDGVSDRRFSRPVWRPEHAVPILKGALPLGVTMLLLSAQMNLPRLSIEKYLGTSNLGIFAAISYFAVAGSMVTNAFGGAAAPRLAAHWCKGDVREFRRLVGSLAMSALALGVVAVIASLLIGREVLQILYGREYALHTDVLVWTMIAAGIAFLASIFGYAATAMARFREQPILLAIVTVVLLSMCRLLVPTHGLVGAAWAMSASSALCLILYVYLVRQNVRSI